MSLPHFVERLAHTEPQMMARSWMSTSRQRSVDETPRALLCTSNGVGLGHVTRMMAIGQALEPSMHSVLFTLSAALPIPTRAGFTTEHLASAHQFDASGYSWNDLLSERVDQLISVYHPDVVLFDGVHPYQGLRDALRANRRRVKSIWVRRGMWKPGVAPDLRPLTKHFDHIIEPGDYARGYDHGITASERAKVSVVAPIVYAHPSSRPGREQSCAELGLRPDHTNVLVQLGAGQINDIDSAVGAVTASLGQHPGVTVAVARSELSADASGVGDSVVEIQRFPISHWFAAFDAAVVAAGYNSFTEVMSLGLPSIIVPNLETKTDDQDARSHWAHDHGLGVRWDGVSEDGLHTAVAAIVDPSERGAMRARLADLVPATGASEAAALVQEWSR